MLALRLVQESEQNRRFVVTLADGAAVEAVLYRGDSLCVSCQVGCAVGCPFCASGHEGLARTLTLDELVGQVEAIRALGHDLAKVTVSGVGEPLHSPALLPFLGYCRGERLAPSLTTSGGPLPRLREAMHAPHNGLTVSVHAGTDATRRRAVPRGPALGPLFSTVSEELLRLSRSRRRKIALSYLLVDGLNDADAELGAFIERARPLSIFTHLYAYNPVPTSGHRPVPRARYEAVYARMTEAGLRVRMSCRARVETNGGCGTLVAARSLVSARLEPSEVGDRSRVDTARSSVR